MVKDLDLSTTEAFLTSPVRISRPVLSASQIRENHEGRASLAKAEPYLHTTINAAKASFVKTALFQRDALLSLAYSAIAAQQVISTALLGPSRDTTPVFSEEFIQSICSSRRLFLGLHDILLASFSMYWESLTRRSADPLGNMIRDHRPSSRVNSLLQEHS